ncbi:amylo-alpha-1,6-glucosidase [Rhodocaloribacter litoris]|uniref:amylo-alpha-1,6-glucosidase n=1 Tax=Rhodocaloribacter litoris TaxID=2558931 RepID=UPI001420F785|nr:GH116 family glycosyl hydrolase [Rhodocaloribacter litoris]QXD16598.1 amylo-alpha-1,6-glucosidase [Rhodocaloribacter litoris]
MKTITPLLFVLLLAVPAAPQARAQAGLVPRFALPESGLRLERPVQNGAFFDVLGRRAAVFGYENRPFEVWAYPLKLVSDVELFFQIADYPGSFAGTETVTHIDVRPEATILTYTHAAFTVRQILFAPVDEMGVVMLLDVDTVRPLTVTVSFRPDLRLMWPAGLMTGNIFWDEAGGYYGIVEETGRFAGVLGAPVGRDVSIMPYQEEPRDVPNRLVFEVTPEMGRDYLIPVVVAGSVEGIEAARATYERLRDHVPERYAETVRYYRDLLDRTVQIDTPDDRLDEAFAWAKIGTDKGLATNPYLGTGFVAGFRTAGNSERPGFAWFFGRDALWTTFALLAYGDVEAARTALDFLKQFQRDDGKIPHEISQSAALLDWFEDYSYPWNSADATPLFIIAHADHFRATGDVDYLRANWEALKKAYAFTAATDTDGNGLVENTRFGHGWVEGGELYPAHEEIYMQGLWIEAARSLAELAEALGETDIAAEARAAAERTRRATEEHYWLEEAGHYAFATRTPGATTPERAEAMYDEDTVLPAVPMWWGVLDAERAQASIDHLGAGALATDWGTRILAATSDLYDPLSYHNGSVWPLFTGWASMAAYRYDRPHVGHQALMATALLTYQDALGYVTELLSGDFNTAFGRSSHHQVWSEAMVITPAVRGLFGVEARDAGRTLRLAPQVPADWDGFTLTGVRAGDGVYTVTMRRTAGETRLVVERTAGTGAATLELAPAFPMDVTFAEVRVNDGPANYEAVYGPGDVQRARVRVTSPPARVEVVYTHTPGTDVYVHRPIPAEGARNEGLRILRSRAMKPEGAPGRLELVVEGRGGRTYTLHARTPHRIGPVEGVTVTPAPNGDTALAISFEGPAHVYVRRIFRLPLE